MATFKGGKKIQMGTFKQGMSDQKTLNGYF